MADDEEGILLPKTVTEGKIIKTSDENGNKRYDFQFANKRGYKTTVEGLSHKFDKEFWNYAKLISGVLRYGMPIDQVIKLVSGLQLDNESINTWKVGVERALKKYIQDGTEAKETKETKTKKKKKSAAALEIELKKSEEKAAEMTDKYQRLMAEFENARKRNAKEQSHMYDVGAKEVLAKLLPVVDNFERGLDALSEEEKEGAFAQGFIKIYQQMITVLEEIGVKPMDAVGKEFNPDFHNAVMHEENEEMGENLVSEEFQKGYMYRDSVVRHSMVKVAN